MTSIHSITKASSRLVSLDVFRGLTIMFMILVNNPGDWGHIYKPLEHAEWNGCTLADLVFPFFLFIVGVSTVYSLETKKQIQADHGNLMLRILRRAATIFGLGLFMSLYWYWDFSTVRIPGVLQRIALVYLLCGLIYVKTDYRIQTVLLLLILIGYYLLMTHIPVPGYGKASLQPETNLGAWLDRLLFTPAHLWNQSHTWDPEGLLGTLPAMGTTLLGILTGTWLKRQTYTEGSKVGAMLVVGILLAGAGLWWNVSFPINKALWTSSYVLFTGGLAIIVFSLFYFLVDVLGYKKWTTPFVVYGVNPITVFVASGLLARTMNKVQINFQGQDMSLSTALYGTFFQDYFSPINASLFWAISFVLVWMIILWIMYNRRIIIKI
jgi:predicted acyltransferase